MAGKQPLLLNTPSRFTHTLMYLYSLHIFTHSLITPRSLPPTVQDGYTLSDHGMVEIVFAVPPVSTTPPEVIDPQVTPLHSLYYYI